MIIRDFDQSEYNRKEQFIRDLVKKMNKKYGNRFTVNIREQYENIYNYIKDKPYIVNLALDAYRKSGLKPNVQSFRGELMETLFRLKEFLHLTYLMVVAIIMADTNM